jgi:acetolactate synthase-1/2/3 large subunit
LENESAIRRNKNEKLTSCIASWKADDTRANAKPNSKCGIDPMQFILALRKSTKPDALTYVDVTLSEHWAAEAFTTRRPRHYFNPTDNQAMGWSIPASIGGQKAFPNRQVVTITGDGCFLMSAMEISTTARECLPVKFFVLDDQTYHYMQKLQKQAYLRTTATILARMNYEALAKGFGVDYHEIKPGDDLEASIQIALDKKGPVLTRVITDYGQRPVRWIDAVKDRYTKELSGRQKLKFIARMGARALDLKKDND